MPFLSSVEDAEHPPTRRGFLKAAAMAVLSLALPKFLATSTNATSFWFLHTETGESLPVGGRRMHRSARTATSPRY